MKNFIIIMGIVVGVFNNAWASEYAQEKETDDNEKIAKIAVEKELKNLNLNSQSPKVSLANINTWKKQHLPELKEEEPLISIEEAWKKGKNEGEVHIKQLEMCQKAKQEDENHSCEKCAGRDLNKELVRLKDGLQWWIDHGAK